MTNRNKIIRVAFLAVFAVILLATATVERASASLIPANNPSAIRLSQVNGLRDMSYTIWNRDYNDLRQNVEYN